MGIGDWGLGIGDWGLGIGPNPQSPIPIISIVYYLLYKINNFKIFKLLVVHYFHLRDHYCLFLILSFFFLQ